MIDTVKHMPLACCPFCGGKAKLASYRVAEDAMGCHVECTSCRVQTEPFEDAYAPIGDAISAWNRRSTDPIREKLLKALPDLSHVISWLENGCDPASAAKELRIHQERIDDAISKATGADHA